MGGPWTGTYVTAMEGSLRVPFMIRWPDKVPAGRVRAEKSARDFYPIFMASMGAPELYAIKWRNYKLHFIWQERKYDVAQKLAIPRLIDLYDSPQERSEETSSEETIGESSIETRGWVLHAMFAQLLKFKATLAIDTPVPMGSTDPCVPLPSNASNLQLQLPGAQPQD